MAILNFVWQVANLMLNMACNERLLPSSELARHVSEEIVPEA